MNDVGIILSNPRRAAAFRAFLAERGCDLLAPTNKYEALRFKRAGRTNVYEFAGNKTEITKQIGNAVPVRTARALVGAALWDMAA